jgi:hypothetical protein
VLPTPVSTQGFSRPTASSRQEGQEKADEGNDDFQEPDKTVNVLFGGLPTRQSQKATRREVLNIEPAVPTPLRWSEVPITFSCADQWTSFSEPGRFPLVLKSVVAGSKLNKVLIDGGSGLNVLFTKTLKKMKLDITHMLTKSTSPFYGIVPGNAAIPLGSVVLPVIFGETRENYRTEYIKFEVADNKNVEAYVDDVVVKTQNCNTLIADLEETFASLREYQWKLNPNKCVFGVPSRKLLGFIISHRGIEANPEKISAITKMKALTCIKDVQKLTGCMAALKRFISKLGERELPFFKLLKHQEKFVWTQEAEQALAQLKHFLSKPPVLTAPRKKEQLLLYLTATIHVVSTAIIVEWQEDGHAYPVQRQVYFVSEVLSDSKARYQPVQKLL